MSAGSPGRNLLGIRGWVDGHRYAAVGLVMLALAAGQVALLALRGGPLETRWEYLGLEAALAGLAILVFAAALDPANRLETLVQELGRRLGRAAWLALLGLILTVPLLALGPWGRFFQPLWVRAVALWLLALAASVLLEPVWPTAGPAGRLITTALAAAVAYQAATQLPGISSSPFSLAWSEASRYYYASLYLSERIYGVQAPLSVLHPSRYLLQALPFLLPNSPIWLHRLWQALLWLGLPLLTVGLLARRLKIAAPWERAAYVMWAFLFVFQGPILYHLLLAVVPVLWGVQPQRFWRSLLWVLLGSIWAGLSRINWFAMAGFTAAAIYILETPRGDRGRWGYWSWPLGWIALGGLAAMATNAAYVVFSGNLASEFGSSFTSDLLWYRLLPNPTFAPGVLLATALISAAPALVLRTVWKDNQPAADTARWLPLAAIAGLLLAGGVVVSVKIGGGSNLHNLDTYLLLLLVIVSYAGLGRTAGWPNAGRPRLGWGGWLLLMAIPILFNLKYGGPVNPQDRALSRQVLEQLRGQITAAGADPRVLLISERQLLTFGELRGFDLIPAYEKVFLMEMAMSGTQPYLGQFHAALREQRFDLIISDPLAVQFQGRSRAFGEENDAWVNQVSIPVLCFYEPVFTQDRAAVQVLVPREQAPACPDLPAGG